MAQMTKDFAENLLKRVRTGQHINTTVWEEEQLLIGWLYWHEHVYLPKVQALKLYAGDPFAIASQSAAHGENAKEK